MQHWTGGGGGGGGVGGEEASNFEGEAGKFGRETSPLLPTGRTLLLDQFHYTDLCKQ